MRFNKGDVYTGEVDEKGLPHGRGQMDYKLNGYYATYEGEWEHGERSGRGHYHKFSSGGGARHSYEYEGEWLHDMENGEGVSTKSDEVGIHLSTVSEVYTGTFKDGKRHGHGIVERDSFDGRFASGKDRFEGEFEEGRTVGHGVWVYADGDRFEGEFDAYFMKQGHGVYTFADGLSFEGEWKNGDFVFDSFQASAQVPVLLVREHHEGFDYNKSACFLIPVRKEGLALYSEAAVIYKDTVFDIKGKGINILAVSTDSVTVEIAAAFMSDGKPVQTTIRRGETVRYEDGHSATATIYGDDYDYTVADSIEITIR